jgi:hypothetical protein
MNKHQLLESWSAVIDKTIGHQLTEGSVNLDPSKKLLVSTICQLQENHEMRLRGHLNENNPYATLGSVNGMGDVSLPSTQGNGWSTGDTGSGDVPYSLLPLAIQVAAQTIGLELVPTIPMNGPVGMLSYMDFVYAGGKNGYAPQNDLYAPGTDGKAPNSPIYIKTTLDGYTNATVGATADVGGEVFEVIGQSRIDGDVIFKLPRELSGTNTVASLIPPTTDTVTPVVITFGGGATAGIVTKAELVKGLEDHVVDFTTNQGASEFNEVKPMSRLEGETTPANVGNLKLFSKSVEAETIQAAAAVTREQMMDLKQFGIDAVAQINQYLANEMTQTINKHILSEIFALGKTNHDNIEAVSGKNYHLVLDSATAPLTIGVGLTGFWNYFGAGKVVQSVDAANLGAENLGTRQRRLMSRMLASSNIISIRGRRGPATFAVCSGGVASGFQDCAGFVPYPLANTINQVPGALYPIGTLAGVAIYVDPNMAWEDGRIAVGRKGDGSTPGLVFMPYVMADTVETIAEGTMAPKVQMKSRYKLVHAGHHPETMYLTFGVENKVDNLWA